MINYQYKVSVIVPCYNTKPWLDECLQSLVDQTLQKIEIICVNDGSTDGTAGRLDEWQSQYPDKINVLNQSNDIVNIFLTQRSNHMNTTLRKILKILIVVFCWNIKKSE